MNRLIQGTWLIGENKEEYKKDYECINYGIQKGLTTIDTAEMYGDGESEILIGDVIKNYRRNDLYLISKVYLWNTSRDKLLNSLTNSLKRLNTNYLDLYLLHWDNNLNLEKVINNFEELKEKGLIKNWGVSNIDTPKMKKILSYKNGNKCYANQVLYNIKSRGIEFDLIPYLVNNNIKILTYSPLIHNDILRKEVINNKVLNEIAKLKNITIYQLLLAFVLRNENINVICKTNNIDHIDKNIKALNIKFTENELNLIDREFNPPKNKIPLEEI